MSDFKLNPINLEDEQRRKKLIQIADNTRDVTIQLTEEQAEELRKHYMFNNPVKDALYDKWLEFPEDEE